ncbi:MAG: hypothetical protein ACE5QW_09575 [Thermoplasmata archaeon]
MVWAVAAVVGLLVTYPLANSAVQEDKHLAYASPEWSFENLDEVSKIGVWPYARIDKDGFPAVVYWGSMGRTLARLTSSGWQYYDLPDVYGLNDWVFDNDGNVHILTSVQGMVWGCLYYWYYNWTSWTKVKEWFYGGAVNPWRVSSVGGRIEIDSQGVIHILRVNSTTKYYVYQRFVLLTLDNKEWSETVLREGYSGITVYDFKLDSYARPHFLLYWKGLGGLCHALFDGQTLHYEIVDPAPRLLRWYDAGAVMDLSSVGNPHVVWIRGGKLVGDGKEYYSELVHAWRNGSAWTQEVLVSSTDPGTEVFPLSPRIAIDPEGSLHLAYFSYALGIHYMTDSSGIWTDETVESGGEEAIDTGRFPSLAVSPWKQPHLFYFDRTNVSLKYATKADLTPSRSVSLDIDPDTLNLKSRGRWITAYLNAENASVYDIDISSIRLQDTLEAERYDYQDDVLMLKFNRQDFKDTVQVGESVQIKLTGKWKDGTAFEAYDSIRVIEPGR